MIFSSRLDGFRASMCTGVLVASGAMVLAGPPHPGSSNCCRYQDCNGQITVACSYGNCLGGNEPEKCCTYGGCNPDWAYATCVPLTDDCPTIQ